MTNEETLALIKDATAAGWSVEDDGDGTYQLCKKDRYGRVRTLVEVVTKEYRVHPHHIAIVAGTVYFSDRWGEKTLRRAAAVRKRMNL